MQIYQILGIATRAAFGYSNGIGDLFLNKRLMKTLTAELRCSVYSGNVAHDVSR